LPRSFLLRAPVGCFTLDFSVLLVPLLGEEAEERPFLSDPDAIGFPPLFFPPDRTPGFACAFGCTFWPVFIVVDSAGLVGFVFPIRVGDCPFCGLGLGTGFAPLVKVGIPADEADTEAYDLPDCGGRVNAGPGTEDEDVEGGEEEEAGDPFPPLLPAVFVVVLPLSLPESDEWLMVMLHFIECLAFFFLPSP